MGVSDYEIDIAKGEITSPILPGKKFQYKAGCNLKAFLKDLHTYLITNEFIDTVKVAPNFRLGELIDQEENENRRSDMFETHFLWIKHPPGQTEIEVKWIAKKHGEFSTKYGEYEFKLNLDVRDMREREILEGNEKKVIQFATWEFRNKLTYTNSFIKKYLDKIPFIKNSELLKKAAVHSFYHKTLDADIAHGIKMRNEIRTIIEKHMSY